MVRGYESGGFAGSFFLCPKRRMALEAETRARKMAGCGLGYSGGEMEDQTC